jgi:RNA polymerase sigma factor (sigma-70 family)
MSARSPTALVRACQRGEPGAWDELLERYGRLIWSVALRLGAREEEAEEVFQRVWVAVVEGLGGLRQPARLASWIASTTRHQTYQLYSEHGRQRRLGELAAPAADAEPAAGIDLEGELVSLEEEAALRDAVELLDGRCRQLLELLFFVQPTPSYEEISHRTGLAVGSIGPIRARCLERLRRAFVRLYQNGGPADV